MVIWGVWVLTWPHYQRHQIIISTGAKGFSRMGTPFYMITDQTEYKGYPLQHVSYWASQTAFCTASTNMESQSFHLIHPVWRKW